MAPKQRAGQNPSGLGRAIINKKVKDARQQQESSLYTTEIDNTIRLKSVTQEKDLDEFLNTAQLAGTEFTAEKRNVKIIQSPVGPTHNPYLLSDQEEEITLQKHQANKQRLRVPRRPPWTKAMTMAQLERQEKDSFLEWRRGLAELQEQEKFLLTPFERNLEVWRQLWRVVERSHLVIQIVDARNPLRFRCEDLEAYVKDIEGPEGEKGTGGNKRKSLLLINKADLLTVQQRRHWADFFDKQGVQFTFFSAANAVAIQEARRNALAEAEAKLSPEESFGSESESDNPPTPSAESSDSEDIYNSAIQDEGSQSLGDETEDEYPNVLTEDDPLDGQDPRIRVLSVMELEDLFVTVSPDLDAFRDSSGNRPTKLVVGLVGYPNVGKSSTINALVGEKKVSVSSTPGKTKHFQTIHLSPTIVLCDCPGLVFPQFTTTKAALVCDGVLPIDQMREYSGPTSLVVKRLPIEVLEATYGLNVKIRGADEVGDVNVTAEDFLISYAIARGFMRSGQGNPDEARAARYILKDYVNAKLLFCHPPPGVTEKLFNGRTHELALLRASSKKRAPETRVAKNSDTFVPPNSSSTLATKDRGNKSQRLDMEFFTNSSNLSFRPFVQGSIRDGQEFSRERIYPHQNILASDGTPLGERNARIATVLVNEGDIGSKKHHKKNKRIKQRSGRGYD
ncbi:hypothetical protein SERLA73DRAFT_174095 [Serpula lacrymans var. lacrymans S7.3]|uniref:CP-type G domain-containing protein n=2 Tax=Serpula lacrymans var. lacrymans TaxID=341189 RepID=F8PI00_SERL3|nr:uncharacterized protein SERLADRAFT_455143 [Serpula lacrymans var. lacrymans S7.9]EGO05096.1 hypothetical protein SERLA73DRAFT_174095 [Serpula lacrymans var. lacrymans S7.3]EGO30862.1 hypothetical protein SERLADRAFT_455143 [Serpula lacrymans var. lacrymans S7.9]